MDPNNNTNNPNNKNNTLNDSTFKFKGSKLISTILRPIYSCMTLSQRSKYLLLNNRNNFRSIITLDYDILVSGGWSCEFLVSDLRLMVNNGDSHKQVHDKDNFKDIHVTKNNDEVLIYKENLDFIIWAIDKLDDWYYAVGCDDSNLHIVRSLDCLKIKTINMKEYIDEIRSIKLIDYKSKVIMVGGVNGKMALVNFETSKIESIGSISKEAKNIHTDAVKCIIKLNSNTIITCSFDKTLKHYNINKDLIENELDNTISFINSYTAETEVRCLVKIGYNKLLYGGDMNYLVELNLNVLYIDISIKKIYITGTGSSFKQNEFTSSMATIKNHKYLICGTNEKLVILDMKKAYQVIKKFCIHEEMIRKIKIMDSDIFVTSGDDGRIVLYTMEDKVVDEKEVKKNDESNIPNVPFSFEIKGVYMIHDENYVLDISN